MAAFRNEPIKIGRNWWTDVSNETAAGATYSLNEVLRAGGEVPHIFSISSEKSVYKKKPNRKEIRSK